ncbi:MAG: UDP-N-acetylglucosamine 4,6-dehydratase (inverting) [Fibrobacterales bacterium]
MFNNKKILITGGTGSFGNKFIQMTLEKYNPAKIVIFSRDEMKQWDMAKRFGHDKRLRFFIGDVRDRDRLYRAMNGIDYVVHAAALKIVPTAEYNPFEYIKTNINGAMNVIDAAIDCGITKVVALSTDKACNPINLYGATKLCSDKLFVAGNAYTGEHKTKFSVVRYGNVMCSRGSVIPLFIDQAKKGKITITDPNMTRFMITLEQGVDLVWKALEESNGGEIFVKKIPSMKVGKIANAIAPEAKIDIIGVRPGEKQHELMIATEDAPYTREFDDCFIIYSRIQENDTEQIEQMGKIVAPDFRYSSENNTEWMTRIELQKWLGSEGYV